MPLIDLRRGLVFLFFGVFSLNGQQPPATPPPAGNQLPQPFTVVLDAAHGGHDTGAHLSEKLEEKDYVLDFTVQLRSTLAAHGFAVTTTREMDVNLPPSRRAEVANHREAAACLLLHATASGHGIHLYTSSLAPTSLIPFLPWDSAQSAYVQQSVRLSSELNSALTHAQLPVSLGRTSLLPLDNLTCPAVAVEIAPPDKSGEKIIPLTDLAYQKQVLTALVAGLEEWRHDRSLQP